MENQDCLQPSDKAKAFADRVIAAFESGEAQIELLPNDYPDADEEMEKFAIGFKEYLQSELAKKRMAV